jgi:hypothetical protein
MDFVFISNYAFLPYEEALAIKEAAMQTVIKESGVEALAKT